MKTIKPNPQSHAFAAFMQSAGMREKWRKAIEEGMSKDEMENKGIKPIGIKE